ncbi:MAG: serine/threonine protein kinase [Myxococcota bacterium]|nr:serine/threonine protein kinase [Myxococcota bacterium]
MAAPLQIGKYELVRKLASGGMAEVYLARAAGPAGFQKTLVVKRILPHLAEDPKFVAMFLAEARLAAALNHPGVVQIFDFGEADDAYYLAMEYVDGPDLGTLWRAARGRLPISHAVKIISLACEGLDYAHEFRDAETGQTLNIVHRDVSPDNILLSRQGAVKVTDFGVAKAATTSQHTQAGTLKGKFAYMAPEQLRGKPLDRRADVYSAAATLYEALAGNRLFDVEGELALLNAVAREPHVDIRSRRAEIPEALSRILDKALAKDPARRYPTCRALGLELENFLRASDEVVGTYELSSLVAKLAEPVPAENAAGRSGMRPAPVRSPSTPPTAQAAAPSRQRGSAPQGELTGRLKNLARLEAVREWLSAMTDPSLRRQAIDTARQFPRTHPLETVLAAGSAVLVIVTLWILLSSLFVGS